MKKVKRFNDAFLDEHLSLIRDAIREADEVREHIPDPQKDREVNLELERLKIKQGLIKQANNAYKNTLSKHIAASKLKDFPLE